MTDLAAEEKVQRRLIPDSKHWAGAQPEAGRDNSQGGETGTDLKVRVLSGCPQRDGHGAVGARRPGSTLSAPAPPGRWHHPARQLKDPPPSCTSSSHEGGPQPGPHPRPAHRAPARLLDFSGPDRTPGDASGPSTCHLPPPPHVGPGNRCQLHLSCAVRAHPTHPHLPGSPKRCLQGCRGKDPGRGHGGGAGRSRASATRPMPSRPSGRRDRPTSSCRSERRRAPRTGRDWGDRGRKDRNRAARLDPGHTVRRVSYSFPEL